MNHPDTPLSAPSAPLLHCAGGVATITLNRPAQRNRLELGDLDTLLAHFRAIDQDPEIRVLLLTANTAGQPRPVFCAGFDIGGFDTPGRGATDFETVPEALSRLRPITVCALNGSVYGGATDLVLASDLVLGLQGLEWRMPATALGLHYYPSGLRRYINRLGEAGARRAFLTARPFDAQRLQSLGLLEAVVAPEDWETQVQALVRDVLALAPLAVQATKRSLHEIATGDYQPERLRERQKASSQTEDFAEGRRAFAERRPPVFRGR